MKMVVVLNCETSLKVMWSVSQPPSLPVPDVGLASAKSSKSSLNWQMLEPSLVMVWV